MPMKKLLMALTLPVTAGIPLYAQEATQPQSAPQITQEKDAPNANWFSFGPQFGLNLNARFHGIGHEPATSPGPATGGGLNRTYNDGYVHVDSSGNAGGETWNWGYQNASQVSGNTITMHSATGGNGSLRANNDPEDGFDLAYGHDFGTAPGGKWGLQGAFDFTSISINDNQPVTTHGTVISDAYTFEGVVIPDAPYRGSFNGPGPLLGDSPTRTTANQTVLVTGGRRLDAQVYVLRGGPYYELKLSDRFSGRVGAGLTLAVADMQYSFDETLNFGGGNTVKNSGSGSGAEFGVGGYLEARLLFAMTDHTSLYFATQYEYLGAFSHRTGDESAQLDLSNTLNLLLGVQWNF